MYHKNSTMTRPNTELRPWGCGYTTPPGHWPTVRALWTLGSSQTARKSLLTKFLPWSVKIWKGHPKREKNSLTAAVAVTSAVWEGKGKALGAFTKRALKRIPRSTWQTPLGASTHSRFINLNTVDLKRVWVYQYHFSNLNLLNWKIIYLSPVKGFEIRKIIFYFECKCIIRVVINHSTFYLLT